MGSYINDKWGTGNPRNRELWQNKGEAYTSNGGFRAEIMIMK